MGVTPETSPWVVERPHAANTANVPYLLANDSSGLQNSSFADNFSDYVTDSVDGGEGGGIGDKPLGQILWMFVGPVIFVTGCVGNMLVLAVMGRRRMQGTSTSLYLRCMALADFCVLITGMIPEWLEQCDIITFKKIHPATCKLEKFAFYTCADTAIWILMVFTVDRFIAVCFPLNKKQYCVTSRTKYYVIATVLVGITKNFHVFWTRGAEFRTDANNVTYLRSNCGRPEPYREFELFIRPWIAMSLVSIVPFTIILICNVFIIRALLEVRRLRTEQAISSQSDKTLIQMTVMCLSASFCFLICVAPSIVILIGRPHWQEQSWYDVAKAVNNQLVYVNHSVNFFLYCLTGKRFRHELMRMCRCGIYRNFGSSPISSMADTTVYKVSHSNKIGSSPMPQTSVKNSRLMYPPRQGNNGALKQSYNKLSTSNHRLNAHRPTEPRSVSSEKAEEGTQYESVM